MYKLKILKTNLNKKSFIYLNFLFLKINYIKFVVRTLQVQPTARIIKQLRYTIITSGINIIFPFK